MPRSESYIESVDRAIYEGDSDEDESKWSSPLVAARNGAPELSPIRKRGWTMLLPMACLRLVVAPLLCMAMLAAMFRNLFKGLHRDLVVYPRELICGPNASAVGFGLQLTLQIWLGALFAIAYGIAGSILVPMMCLLGFRWAAILNALTKHKMERPLASKLLAALPVWGDRNVKLQTFCVARCTDMVSALVGESEANTKDDAMELLDEINVIKGGLFPFDQLTVIAVARAAEHGVSLNAADDLGKTALHYAAERGGFWGGLPRTIETLLKRGADPNAQDADGKTALHYAVCPEKLRPSNQKVIQLLASAPNADLRIADKKGRTALMATPMTYVALRKTTVLGGSLGVAFAAAHLLITLVFLPRGIYEPVAGIRNGTNGRNMSAVGRRRMEAATYASFGWLVVLVSACVLVTLHMLSSRAKLSARDLLRHLKRPDPGIVRMLLPRTPSWSQLEAALLEASGSAADDAHTDAAGVGTDAPACKHVDDSATTAIRTHVSALQNNARLGSSGGTLKGGEASILLMEDDAPPPAPLHQPCDLRWLRIRDMVSCGCGELVPEQLRRQKAVFEKVIYPLVMLAVQRPLDAASKALLIEAVAATGFRGSRQDHRRHYRQRFDALLQAAMTTFESILADQLHALRCGSPAARALVQTIPLTEMFGHAPSSLFQESVVGATAPWRCFRDLPQPNASGDSAASGAAPAGASPNLCDAYAELKLRGAVRTTLDLCDLLQCGQHPWFGAARPNAFANCAAAGFWQNLGALLIVAQAKELNDEFQRCVGAVAARIPGVLHKPAAVKQCDRVVDKAAEYHAALQLPNSPGGGLQSVGRVVDIQRCSLCVDDAETAAAVFEALETESATKGQLVTLRRKNGFAKEAGAVGGYRDVKYNMRFQSQTVPGPWGCAIVEIQVILNSYLTVKKRMHAVYRVHRGDFG